MSSKLVVPTEVFSRISGYFRPVQQWNKGKREEFKNRRVVSPGRVMIDRVSGACLSINSKHRLIS
jgi:ribonucleoside-triphosphate reductase